MQLPIPDDYELGEGLTCFQVYWPDTPYWIGILQGLITSIQQGRLWDERTGSILAVQAIGREIEAATLPLVTCCGDDGNDGNQEQPQTVEINLGECLEEFCEMSGCSIPYGALKYIDGVLYYRYCGDWYPVEGDAALPGSVVTQPDDPDAPEFDPEEFETATACSKATVLMNVVFGVVDELLDSAEVPETPAGAISAVKSRFPNIDWGDAALLSAYSAAVVIRLQGYSSEVENETFQGKMLCLVSLQISAGNQGLTEDERYKVQEAIETVCNGTFSLVTHPTVFGSVVQMYKMAYRAIGATDTTNITSYAFPTGDEVCDCGDFTGEPTYYGTIWFTGAATIVQQAGTTLSVYRTGNNGRWIELDWLVPAGQTMLINDQNNLMHMQGTGTISTLTFRITKVPGYRIPAAYNDVEDETITGYNFVHFSTGPWMSQPVTYTWGTDYKDGELTIATPQNPSGSSLNVRGIRQHPWHTTTTLEHYRWRIEIYECNGVIYG